MSIAGQGGGSGSSGGVSPVGGAGAGGVGGAGASGAGGNLGGQSTGGTGGTTVAMPRDPLPCFIDEGTEAAEDLSLAVSATRVNGVAPLVVFFDTLGTTSAATDRPFHELAYCWDFDDPDSGAFPTNGEPKNQAKGPVAAHVFEKPGTYAVTVTARDATGRFSSRGVDIVVEDPELAFAGAATVCFANANDFEGCPEGAQQVTTSNMSALSEHIAPSTRLLLRRGDVFQGGSVSINVAGPGLIGAFGDQAAARPRIEASDEVFGISGSQPAFADWRIMDLDVVGMADDAYVINVGGRSSDLLALRIRATNIAGGIHAPPSIIDYLNENGFPGHDVIDVLAVQDCEFRDLVGGSGNNLSYIGAHHLIVQGTTMWNSAGGEHVLRLPWVDRGVISNNVLGEAPHPRALIKLHAPGFNLEGIGQGKYSERVVLSGNAFHCTGAHDWSVVLSPQNEMADERLRDLIVERNFFLPGSTSLGLMLQGVDGVTVRDNVFNRGTESRTCAEVSQRGPEPPSTNVVFLHNTCYTEHQNPPILVQIGPTATNVRAFANLLLGPGARDAVWDARLTEQANNLVAETAGLQGDDMLEWESFTPTSDSPVVDAALSEHRTAWDLSGRPRPVDGDDSGAADADIGALEYVP
jgi:hypothetical protein